MVSKTESPITALRLGDVGNKVRPGYVDVTYTNGLKDERHNRMVSTVNISTTLHFTSSSQENLGTQQGVAQGKTTSARSSTKQTPPRD
jgi:hypothetical protein